MLSDRNHAQAWCIAMKLYLRQYVKFLLSRKPFDGRDDCRRICCGGRKGTTDRALPDHGWGGGGEHRTSIFHLPPAAPRRADAGEFAVLLKFFEMIFDPVFAEVAQPFGEAFAGGLRFLTQEGEDSRFRCFLGSYLGSFLGSFARAGLECQRHNESGLICPV